MMPVVTIMALEIHKTAARTSMMRLETIMTTEIRYHFIDGVSRRNDVLFLAVNPAFLLAAGVWTAHVADSVPKARFDCLTYAIQKLSESCPEWDFWLIAGHKALQPDNRITRHNGLWKSLQKAGVAIPEGQFIDESILESENSLRVFGAVRFDFGQIKAVHAVMTVAQAAVVFLPKLQAENSVSSLVRHGWDITNTKPPEEILEAVSTQLGIVVDIYGDFDDPEVSVAAIGKKDVLLNLNLAQ